MFRQIAALCVAAVISALGAPSFAAELSVPGQYATIQAAIDAAEDGDTVIISPGTYTGDGNRDIDFKGKAITVRSTDPNDPNAVWVTGDYHLSQIAAGQAADSPCVDAGSEAAATVGMHRFTTRTDKVPDTGIVDMGYHYVQAVADLNDDGVVDILDLAILASQWRQGQGEPSADIAPPHGDGLIDLRDLALLADSWLWP